MNLGARIAEKIEVGSALVIFGYMAVRSQWNHLGIASLPDVGADRYLMELYGIVAGELPVTLLFLTAGLLITLVIRGVLLFLHRKPSIDGRLRDIESRGKRALPFIAVVLLVIAQLWFFLTASGTEPRCRSDVILGDLATLVAARCGDERPVAEFYTVVFLCVLTGLATRKMRSDGRTIWRVVIVALIVVSIQLPLIYGVAIKQARFPGAQLRVEEEALPLTGLIVLQTPNAVEMWTVQNGKGRIVVVPSGRITQMTVGRVCDLFSVARTQVTVPPQPLLEACGLEPPLEKLP